MRAHRCSQQLLLLCAVLIFAPAGALRALGALPLPRAVAARARAHTMVAQSRELTQLMDAEEYQAKIDEATQENKVVVIKFFASWCRACKAMAPKFQRVAEDWPEIEFCEILFDNNKKLCKSLGIKILPYVEVISGNQGKVDGFSCGPSKISRLQERLEVHGGCEEIPCTDVSALLPEV